MISNSPDETNPTADLAGESSAESAASQFMDAGSPTASIISRSESTKAATVRLNRKQLWDTWQAMKSRDKDLTWRQAANVIGCGVSLYRLIKAHAAIGDAAFDSRVDYCGRKSDWEYLLKDEAVQNKLRENYAASLASASEGSARDRHTGDMVKACQHFAREPECPEALAKKLLRRKIPACIKRFLRGITPEIEAKIRGDKDFKLNGYLGQRAKLIGLPGGKASYLPAGWIIELDDMSVNQPYWVEDSNGVPILTRQCLVARCVKGRFLAAELVARVRESYTSGDILRFIQRLFELLGGMPRVIRIEQSVWASLNIAGFALSTAGDWSEGEVERPAMDEENRMNLSLGLAALGIQVEYCTSARGKSDLEGSFHPLQGHLAQFTKDFVNVGRRRGEFERMAKQLRRVRAGSHHPQDLGFAHQNQLADRIQQTFDFMNGTLPIINKRTLHDALLGGEPVETQDQLWLRDTQLCPLKPLPPDADLAFLPVLRKPTIKAGAVFPKVDGIEYAFRAVELAELGDGYSTYVRFDPGDLSKPAAIHNREGRNSRNRFNLADGALICRAQFDAPGFTATAIEVPEGLKVVDVEQIYGAGVVPDGGEQLKAQQRWARKAVRTAFTGKLPGQPATKSVHARDGRGNTVNVNAGSTAAAPSQPGRVTQAAAQNPFRPPTADQLAKQQNRISRQAERARALQMAEQ